MVYLVTGGVNVRCFVCVISAELVAFGDAVHKRVEFKGERAEKRRGSLTGCRSSGPPVLRSSSAAPTFAPPHRLCLKAEQKPSGELPLLGQHTDTPHDNNHVLVTSALHDTLLHSTTAQACSHTTLHTCNSHPTLQHCHCATQLWLHPAHPSALGQRSL